MTPLEKAARAVDPAAFGPKANHDRQRNALRMARAVLMAVREPDEGMVSAGTPHFDNPCWPENVTDAFTAMIDHILRGGETG